MHTIGNGLIEHNYLLVVDFLKSMIIDLSIFMIYTYDCNICLVDFIEGSDATSRGDNGEDGRYRLRGTPVQSALAA